MTVKTATGTYQGKTAAEWREMSRSQYESARESFERCDTDGFLSQAASDSLARKYEYAAELAENGGVMETSAVFDLDGNLIPAKLVNGQYGSAWMLLDGNGDCAGWFNPSFARKDATRIRNNAAKGFYEGTVKVEAKADTQGWNAGIYPAYDEITAETVLEIVDNGR